MDEMFEYLVPITGLFVKKRNPKMLASYQKMEDAKEVVEDFKAARSFLGDSLRIGKMCIFRKEKYTIFYLKDILKATFRVCGSIETNETGTIFLLFKDGSEEILFESSDLDRTRVTSEVFPYLDTLGIQTTYIETR